MPDDKRKSNPGADAAKMQGLRNQADKVLERNRKPEKEASDAPSIPTKSDDPKPTSETPATAVTTSDVAVNVPGGIGVNFTNDAQKIIVLALLVTGIVASIELVANPPKTGTTNPPTVQHIWVGVFVAGGLLLPVSYFLPEFASGLAVVAMVATVFDRGKSFWDVITNFTGRNVGATSTGNAATDATLAQVKANNQQFPTPQLNNSTGQTGSRQGF